MKFNITVQHAEGGESWLEDYNRTDVTTQEQARRYSEQLIQRFNETLRPGEKERKLLDVTFEDNNPIAQHDWHKTNLVTTMDPRLGFYDTMQCVTCGITARRFGLTDIVIDRRRRAKKYKNCSVKVQS